MRGDSSFRQRSGSGEGAEQLPVTQPRRQKIGRLGILLLLVAAAPPADRKDLPAIKAARSVFAEWALVNQLAISARLQASYVDRMRKAAREQLGTNLKSLSSPTSPAALVIQHCLRLPAAAPSPVLQSCAERLRAIEVQLETA